MFVLNLLSKIYHIDKEILSNDRELSNLVFKHLIIIIFFSLISGLGAFYFLSKYTYLTIFLSTIFGWAIGAFIFILLNSIGYFKDRFARIISFFMWTSISFYMTIVILGSIFYETIQTEYISTGLGLNVPFTHMVQLLKETVLDNNINVILAVSFFLVFESLYFLSILTIQKISSRLDFRTIKVDSKKEVESLFNQQAKALSYVQHELGNKLPAVQNDFSYLKKVLIESSSPSFNLKTKVRLPLPGEDPATIDDVSDILNRIEESLNYSIHSLKNAGSIISTNQTEMKLENVFVLDFLRELARNNLDGDKFEFLFSGDEKAIIKVERAQFATVISNIISNAREHGFKNRTSKSIIAYNVKNKPNKLELIIKNNGDPFPDDFTIEDYLTPHRYSGDSGKTGMGGYFIGIILRKHNATISLLPFEQEEEFKVKFLITFNKEF